MTAKNKINTVRSTSSLLILTVLIFVIFLFIFSKGSKPIAVDYLFTTIFSGFNCIPLAINLLILIPKLLKKEKYVFYILSLSVVWGISSILWYFIIMPAIEFIFHDYYFSTYLFANNIFLEFAIILLVSTLINMSADWISFNQNENDRLRKRNVQVESQLTNIKAQINPHFLFNSLNVVYAMAWEGKKEITDAIVQLSDILRHLLYDFEERAIPLTKELQLLDSYIQFQAHRSTQDGKVIFNKDIEDNNFRLSPLLFLPLLENSFKHRKQNTPIELSIKQNDNLLVFKIKNQKSEEIAKHDKVYSGLGLQQLKAQLNLLYPTKYELDIEESKEAFVVSLTLKQEIE